MDRRVSSGFTAGIVIPSAEVVIVGGGIVGASIAYHLTAAGCRNVLVIERESHSGKGSTGKSMGGVRAQFSTPVSIQMSLYSIGFFRDFDEVMRHPSGYRAQGYLFVATTDNHLESLRRRHEIQIKEGLTNTELLNRDEVMRIVPQLRSDDIVGGSFCPTDGFVDPYSVMIGFMLRARDRGAQWMFDTTVTGIDLDARGITGVQTSRGTVATPVAVNAAGAWSAQIANLAGVDLPVVPLRRMLVPTEPFGNIARSAPMTIDMATGFHFRPEGLGLLLAWADPEETPGFKTSFDRAFIEKILTRGVSRLPALEKAEVNPTRAWAGLYEMTPDHHPILGRVPGIERFYMATGFSGHGVMHSPATGKILAELILQGASSLIDTSLLDYARFAEGRLIEEVAVL